MKIRAQLADKRNMFSEVARFKIRRLTIRKFHHVLEHDNAGALTANKYQ